MRKMVIVMVVIVAGLIWIGCGSDSNSSSSGGSGSDNACDKLVMDCSKCTDDLATQACNELVSSLKSRNNSDECKQYNDEWTKGTYDGSTLCK